MTKLMTLAALMVAFTGCATAHARSTTGERYVCAPVSENGDPKPAAKPGEVLTVER